MNTIYKNITWKFQYEKKSQSHRITLIVNLYNIQKTLSTL